MTIPIPELRASTAKNIPLAAEPKRLDFFERYLTVWVFVCMIVGVGVGTLFPGFTRALGRLEFGRIPTSTFPLRCSSG